MTDGERDRLVAEMTLEEKLGLVRGHADPAGRATGALPGVERLGVPPLRLVDGPMGVRDGRATAFPATLALGASWDPALARRVGTALGAEARAKGHHVVLGPGLNVIRVPTCGRNFEYPSEDPRLTAAVAAASVAGIRSAGAAATAKHFVANNQERQRDGVSVVVDERTLRELYLPGFRAAVAAGAEAVMTAYNRVRGRWMSEHTELVEGVLREEWGFDGCVVSDWWGTHDTRAAVEGGLDLEMPGVSPLELYAPRSHLLRALVGLRPSERAGIDPPVLWRAYDALVGDEGQPDLYPAAYFGDRLRRAVASGAVAEAAVDRKVERVLGLYDALGLLDGAGKPSGGSAGESPTVDADAHHDLAREAAVRGTVLLDNDGLLPLSGAESLAVVGPNADAAKVGGGGSSAVTPARTVSPLAALRERASGVTFERGVARVAEPSLFDPPWAGTVRRLRGATTDADPDAAVAAAADADVAVVVVQDGATEGEDRDSLALPGDQDALVAAVAAANDRTVVVCRSSGPVRMPWLDDVAAVVATWYPGQADGAALADVLYGADPGGRLPVTFGRRFADYPVAGDRRYPGVDGHVHYDEGVFVGYRGFDRVGVDPLFPFGHGRSYAAFACGDASATPADDGWRLDVPVANDADRAGREVVQVYVSPPDGPVERPARTLGGFASVELAAGERERVSVSVPRRAFARYDSREGWTVDPGEYDLLVARSSRDVRERMSVTAE
jgi:beta-glucosidase